MFGFLTEINELNYAVLQSHATPASQALLEESGINLELIEPEQLTISLWAEPL